MPVVRTIQLIAIAASGVLAVAPASPWLVERWYAVAFYPRLQSRITSWSNTTPFALFDILILAVATALILVITRSWRRARNDRSWRPIAHGGFAIVSAAATLYLWFTLFWGLNYGRPSVGDALGFDRAKVHPEAVRALGERAVGEANARYDAAHAHGFPGVYDTPVALVHALHDVESRLGRPRPSMPGRPKRTLLAPFFRASGTDGMTAPFFLETMVNPDLTPAERPMVLAHEWAHLSGNAPEDEASFVAVLATVRADVSSQYSAWLSLVLDIASRLPAAERQRLLAGLAAGPKRDWELIAARLRTRVQVVERVSWMAYDRYLRSQGVEEGVVNYSRVIELLIGTGALNESMP